MALNLNNCRVLQRIKMRLRASFVYATWRRLCVMAISLPKHKKSCCLLHIRVTCRPEVPLASRGRRRADSEWVGMNSPPSTGCRELFCLGFAAAELQMFGDCRNEWACLIQ